MLLCKLVFPKRLSSSLSTVITCKANIKLMICNLLVCGAASSCKVHIVQKNIALFRNFDAQL